MTKIFSLLASAFLLMSTLFLTGCSSTTTMTVTGPTVTITSTSQSPPETLTTTVTATTTTTSTLIPTTTPGNPFQGALSGSWTGTETIGTPSVNGSLAVSVDATGNVQGTFNGSFGGSITGTVDQNGNLTATGTASMSGNSIELSWKGIISKSGNSLSCEGIWSDPYGTGTFSAAGVSS
jgi:hypothetical protein